MNPASHTTMCPACGSTELISIALSLDEDAVGFRACHACETKWWERDGSLISLESILSLVPRR